MPDEPYYFFQCLFLFYGMQKRENLMSVTSTRVKKKQVAICQHSNRTNIQRSHI